MRNWTVRERVGLAAIVFAVVMGALGLSINRYQRMAVQDEPPALTQLTPPKIGVGMAAGSHEMAAGGHEAAAGGHEAAARGGDTGSSAGVTITEPGYGEPPAPGASLVVHVLGAVRRPGVYTLKNGDRVYKAIRAAGGFKHNAAQETLNLADKLRDGDQVYVAARGVSEPPPPRPQPTVHRAGATSAASSRSRSGAAEPGRVLGALPPPDSAARSAATNRHTLESSSPAAPAPSGKPEKLHSPGEGTVNLNTAGAEELQRLPGIGPAMAERILDYRKEIGTFNSPEQLLDVRGIGEKKYAVMEPFLRVK